MSRADKKGADPFGKYNYWVEIDGITAAGFKECAGLDASTEVGVYREGNDPSLHVRKQPGLVASSNITLGRGVTQNRELFDWWQKVATGKLERRNISIFLANDAGEHKIQWDLSNAWPCRWTGPALDATKIGRAHV